MELPKKEKRSRRHDLFFSKWSARLTFQVFVRMKLRDSMKSIDPYLIILFETSLSSFEPMNTRPYTVRDIHRDLNFRVLSSKSPETFERHIEQLRSRQTTLTPTQQQAFQEDLKYALDQAILLSNRRIFDALMSLGAGSHWCFEHVSVFEPFNSHPLPRMKQASCAAPYTWVEL